MNATGGCSDNDVAPRAVGGDQYAGADQFGIGTLPNAAKATKTAIKPERVGFRVGTRHLLVHSGRSDSRLTVR